MPIDTHAAGAADTMTVTVPAPGTEERDFWLDAIEQHGGLEPAEEDGNWVMAEADLLKLMAAAREQGRKDVLATASPAPGALADLPRELRQKIMDLGWSVIGDCYLGKDAECALVSEIFTLIASSPAASAPPVDGGGRERIAQIIVEHLGFDTEGLTSAVIKHRQIVRSVEAADAILAHPRPATGVDGLVDTWTYHFETPRYSKELARDIELSADPFKHPLYAIAGKLTDYSKSQPAESDFARSLMFLSNECARQAFAALARHATLDGEGKSLRIVFDGPPGPTAGRFVEVEDADGKSVSLRSWRERPDGLWELRLGIAANSDDQGVGPELLKAAGEALGRMKSRPAETDPAWAKRLGPQIAEDATECDLLTLATCRCDTPLIRCDSRGCRCQVCGGYKRISAAKPTATSTANPQGAGETAGGDETSRCFACLEPMLPGQMVIGDVNEGLMHRACCGPERESFVGADEKPLRAEDAIPAGFPYVPSEWGTATPQGEAKPSLFIGGYLHDRYSSGDRPEGVICDRPATPQGAGETTGGVDVAQLRIDLEVALENERHWHGLATDYHDQVAGLRNQIDALAASVIATAAPEQAGSRGWEPITADTPRDGRDLFLLGRFRDTGGDQPVIGRWFQAGAVEQDGWWSAYALPFTPSGWMPIPAATRPHSDAEGRS